MKKNHAKVFHFDLYGKRENKYDFLIENNIKSINWNELNPTEPALFFVVKNNDDKAEYENGFSVSELFIINGTGIVSKRDALAFQNSKKEIIEKVQEIFNLNTEEIKTKYNTISWDSRDGKVEYCKNNVMKFGLNDNFFVQCNYRPFDSKWTYYNGESKGFIGWPVKQVMQHFLKGDNVGLVAARQSTESYWSLIQVTNTIIDNRCQFSYKGTPSAFPLYLYPDGSGQQSIGTSPDPSKGGELGISERKPNLNMEIVGRIADRLGLAFVAELSAVAERSRNFAPIDILDYIYAVLHSPTYREKYKEFLKIDFPRVPYPKDEATFWELVKLGGEIRQIHLLESPKVEKYITQYPIDGNNVVTKIRYQDGNVYINDTQYFGNVPQIAWEFYIGGYQPAQKWLKDRKERKLEFDDILHYQKIIVALTETDRIMKEIDKIEIE